MPRTTIGYGQSVTIPTTVDAITLINDNEKDAQLEITGGGFDTQVTVPGHDSKSFDTKKNGPEVTNKSKMDVTVEWG
jgi:hypothetical protein